MYIILKMSICYVSTFLDIGRTFWNNKFVRSVYTYLNCFKPFVKLFPKEGKEKMIVFIDEKHSKEFKEMIENSNIHAIEINMDFMSKNIHVWKSLNREREIMNSQEYKTKFANRLTFPENTIPEYTLINHAKIDFVNLAIDLEKQYEYFSWVDFGYFQNESNIPTNLLDLNKLNLNKVNYQLLNPITEEDKNIMYTMIHAPERIGGFFFFGNRKTLKEYQNLYHSILEEFQNNNLADDDQHIVLRCFFKNPSLFHLHYNPKWHNILIDFQKNFQRDFQKNEK